MKLITLLENTACREGLAAAHGLSLYIETPKHKILFDMGPDGSFLDNAKKLGVDLEAVDVAILSHGHFDHGGGLETFTRLNPKAKVYIHRAAFGDFYKETPGEEPEYIGIDQSLDMYRFTLTADETVIDEELTLFAAVPDNTGALAASAMLRQKTRDGSRPDVFAHEQDLLITAEGKTILVAGCAHRGIVNILREAEKRLGRKPDATVGGFHLFQLKEGDPASEKLIDMTGKALLPGDTVYYTGHCTGEYAFEKLKAILGDRLQPISGGGTIEL